jgi:hypothetical protein
MELVIQLLMLFIFVNSILKLSFWKWWQSAVFGLLGGLFIMAIYPAATLQSKTQLADYLANVKVMQDMAVLVTLEASVCFTYCFLISKKLFGGKLSRWGKIVQWYVSLLLFPVLFVVLTQTIYALPGAGFKTISYSLAVLVTVFFPLLSYWAKKLIPEVGFRVEVHFLTSLFVCILGLIATVNGNVVYAAVDEPFDFRALLLSVSLFAFLFLAGYTWNNYKWIIIQRKNNKIK